MDNLSEPASKGPPKTQPTVRRFCIISGNARSLIANRANLLADVQSRGYTVTAIVPTEDYLPGVEQLGVDIIRVPLGRTATNPLADIATVFRLWRAIRSVRPRVVFGYGAKPVVYGMLAGVLAGVPKRFSMVTGLGYAFTTRTAKTAIIRFILSILYFVGFSCAQRVFVQNPDDLGELKRLSLLRGAHKAVLVNGSGIDLDHFKPTPLPKRKMTFLFIGRLLTEKGIEEFCNAAALVVPNDRPVRFIAVGPHDPNLPHSVKAEQLAEWKAAGVVEFPGGIQDVRPWIAEATVLVLPSYREGTPRSVLEAMAMGRPIITTDSPGCRETVIDGHNGLLVTPRTEEPLARAMQTLVDQPERIPVMAQRSLERVREKYDVRKVNACILEAMGIQ